MLAAGVEPESWWVDLEARRASAGVSTPASPGSKRRTAPFLLSQEVGSARALQRKRAASGSSGGMLMSGTGTGDQGRRFAGIMPP